MSIYFLKSKNTIFRFYSRTMAVQHAAFVIGNEFAQEIKDNILINPSWVREDNIAVYDLNTPNRTVRQNYSSSENKLASPMPQRHVLGLVGGNEVSQLAANPQDIESDLRNLTRPLTNCPDREYKPLMYGQDKLVINNRKTHMTIDLRPVHLQEYQMWGYSQVFAPLPLQKETCGRPEKY
jgi:hypothetical protein